MSAESIIEMIEEKFGGRAYITLTVVDWSRLRAEIGRLRGEVNRLNGWHEESIAPAEAKGHALLAAIAASAASAGDYQPHDQVVSMFAVESAIRGAELDTPQPAGGEAVAIYQLVSEDVPREWQDIDKATFDFWRGRDRRTRIVYTTPPAAQVQGKPEWLADVTRCLSDISQEFGHTGRGNSRFEQLLNRINATRWTAAHPSACELGAVRELVAEWRQTAEHMRKMNMDDKLRHADPYDQCAEDLEAALTQPQEDKS